MADGERMNSAVRADAADTDGPQGGAARGVWCESLLPRGCCPCPRQATTARNGCEGLGGGAGRRSEGGTNSVAKLISKMVQFLSLLHIM